MSYPPIEDHGVIGDLDTLALVACDGTIDYCCYPRLDGPCVFAGLLDDTRGGQFRIAPGFTPGRSTQIYLPDTNVLLTRFLSGRGILEVTDFMPCTGAWPAPAIVRLVRAVTGEVPVEMTCQPALDYARARTVAAQVGSTHIRFEAAGGSHQRLQLHASVPMEAGDGAATSRMTLRAGEQAAFLLTDAAVEPPVPCDPHALAGERDGTTAFWRAWLGQIVYRGRWQESVRRSALVLKLLTSRRHGAIAAAGTFGLPEAIGGGRNWDYRYCWIRDSAFSVYAFLRLGFTDEAHAYMDWIQGRFRDCGHCGTLDVLYTLDGRGEPNETELTHLEGYRGSRPVRVGNAAHAQLQLDIYGELLDALYLADKHVHPVPHDTWVNVQRAVEHVAANWQRSDAGIWEVRGGPRAFLHSRLMCWVALDRGLRLATRESLPAPVDRWRAVRDEIYESIFCEFWDPRLGAFVQSAGSKTVDAAALMMPLVRFISPVDPKWLSTLDVIGWRLANDALLHRYDDTEPEGLDGSQEGHFTMCSFWYVECLARAGRVDEAHLLFDKMLSYANHLGLFAEELGIDGCHLGNFPQAFTHLALISAASALERFGGEPMP